MKKWNEKGCAEKNILIYVLSLGFALVEINHHFIVNLSDQYCGADKKDNEKMFDNPDNAWKKMERETPRVTDIDPDDVKNLIQSLGEENMLLEKAFECVCKSESEYKEFFKEKLLSNQKRVNQLMVMLEEELQQKTEKKIKFLKKKSKFFPADNLYYHHLKLFLLISIISGRVHSHAHTQELI